MSDILSSSERLGEAWKALFAPTCPKCKAGISGRHARRCDAESRFWLRVDYGPKCWEWAGFIKNSGYGSFSPMRGKTYSAHRVAFELTYGPIPDGLFVLHRCDNKKCVRPDHLWVGTQAENMRDMQAKGRGFWQARS